MSRRGDCYDNAAMERFFSTVKSELADRFASFSEAKMESFDYIEGFYNQRRRHSTLGQIKRPSTFFEHRRRLIQPTRKPTDLTNPSTESDQVQMVSLPASMSLTLHPRDLGCTGDDAEASFLLRDDLRSAARIQGTTVLAKQSPPGWSGARSYAA